MAAIEQRYAHALADLVAKGDIAAGTLRTELERVVAVVEASQPLRQVLGSPAVAWDKKKALLATLAERLGLSRLTRNFVLVAAERGRIQHVEGIAAAFEHLLLEQEGVVTADVASARSLSEQERGALEAELERRLGRKLRARYRTDPSLVGGFRAQVGDEVYDGSIRGRLQRLRQSLLSA